jgi:hypothetical protein
MVDALLGLTPAERGPYLAQTCGNDVQLRQLVEGMLRAHEQVDALLAQASIPNVKSTVRLPLSEQPGDRIGRYKLLQKLGEGGCGIVYMAEQSEPVKRRVALTRMLHKPVEQMGGRGVRKLENSELYDNQLRRPEPNRL